MCSRTKSGPWKLYGEAVSLPSLQLKRDSKTSSLTPEIWAFPPAHLPLHAPVPVRPFQGENIPESFPQNERPDHSPFFFIFPILTGLGRKLKLRTDLWAFTLFPPWLGLAGGSDGKDSVCNLGDRGVQPLGWADPWRREWKPTPVFLPGESHGQRSLAGYSPWGHKESDPTEHWTLSLFDCSVGHYRGIFKAMTLHFTFTIKTATIYPISAMFCHCLSALIYLLLKLASAISKTFP